MSLVLILAGGLTNRQLVLRYHPLLCFFFSDNLIAYLRNCFLASGGSLSIISCFIKIFAEFFSTLFCTNCCFFRGTPSIILPFSNLSKYTSKSYTIVYVCSLRAKRGCGGLNIFGFWICVGTPMFRVGGPIVHEQSYAVCA